MLHARVTASDIDRVAVEAARGNARLNRAGAAIAFVRAAGANGPRDRGRRALRSDLRQYPARPAAAAGGAAHAASPAPRARIVLSGLLPGHANAVLAIYRAQGFVLERRIPLDGWVTLVLRRG